MPPLRNARHELAVLYRVAGNSQIDAYELAGYSSRNHDGPSRLFARNDVQARICELQDEMAERVVERRTVTMDSLTDEMKENRRLAKELKQMSVAQTASRDLAKMHGFMNEKSVHFHKRVDDMTEAELAALLDEVNGDSDGERNTETTGVRTRPPAAPRHQDKKDRAR